MQSDAFHGLSQNGKWRRSGAWCLLTWCGYIHRLLTALSELLLPYLLRSSSLTAHFCNLFRDFLRMPSPGFNSFLVSRGTTNETWCVVAVDSSKLLDAGFCMVSTNLTKKMQRRADIPGPCGTLVYRWCRQISRCHVCARLKDDVEPDVFPAN